jgi:hypothetical protein
MLRSFSTEALFLVPLMNPTLPGEAIETNLYNAVVPAQDLCAMLTYETSKSYSCII